MGVSVYGQSRSVYDWAAFFMPFRRPQPGRKRDPHRAPAASVLLIHRPSVRPSPPPSTRFYHRRPHLSSLIPARCGPPTSCWRVVQLVRHGIDQGDFHAAMIQGPADPLHVSVLPQQLHRVNLPRAMRGCVAVRPQRVRCPLYVLPDCLTATVFPGVRPRKTPAIRLPIGPQIRQKRLRDSHLPPLPGFLLGHPKIRPKLRRPKGQHVTHPQPGMKAYPHNQPVIRGQQVKDTFHFSV